MKFHAPPAFHSTRVSTQWMGSAVSRASARNPKLLVSTVPSGNPSGPVGS